MTVPGLIVLFLYGLVVTAWKVLHVLMLFYKPRRFFLAGTAPQLANGPRVSILLAARDEEGNVGDCVRSVLSANYTNFELIVIDDRSGDGTAREVEQAAAGDPRVRLLHVRELPPGWTGKMNAIRQGLAVATGELFLIIDADSRHTPQTLGAALHYFDHHTLDLLSLLPRFEHRSLFSRVVQPLVGVLVLMWKPLPWVNSRKWKSVAMGWGGFLLVRRQALAAVGGLEAVKDRFAADIALVDRIKRNGGRTRLLHAPDLLTTHLYTSVPEILNGWTRLLKLTAGQRRDVLLATLAGIVLLGLSAYLAIGVGLATLLSGTGGPFGLLLGLMGVSHLVFQITLLGRMYRISGTSPWFALGHLPAALVAAYLIVLAFLRCGSHQMAWRNTTYQLRADGRAA